MRHGEFVFRHKPLRGERVRNRTIEKGREEGW